MTAIRNRPLVALLVLVLILLADVLGGFLQATRIAQERVESIFNVSRDAHKNQFDQLIKAPLLVPEVLATSKSLEEVARRRAG